MGYAISSFQEAIGTVLEHPTLIAGIGVTSMIGMFLYMFIAYIPFVGMFVAWIIPALMLAAVLTMAYEGVRGTPSFDHLVNGLEDSAVPMILAFLLLMAVYMVAGFGFAIVFVALIFAGAMSADSAADAGAGADPAMFEALGLGIIALFVITFLVIFLVGIIIQFFDAAIVVGDAGVVDAFKASWGVVRSNPISVLGYTLMRIVIGYVPVIVAGILAGIGALIGSGDQAFYLAALLAVLGFVVVGPIVWTIMFVYHVSYFDQASGNRSTAI
ncbi:DUF7847 domain-containing protein [Natrarchaeobius chitinivorans]|uniref:DUF7847 domain-containing protein n=1 Tax=Natrarchaeobius chitinivorans TaxID=1679083 RepID=A0A3N6M570_NATCH|nr:hypothetical protein [Natrarchaeobius chitinivorans]RQG90411.1 hypothetical protein EA473_21325 [Natrarchaeobius chitinivorans]